MIHLHSNYGSLVVVDDIAAAIRFRSFFFRAEWPFPYGGRTIYPGSIMNSFPCFSEIIVSHRCIIQYTLYLRSRCSFAALYFTVRIAFKRKNEQEWTRESPGFYSKRSPRFTPAGSHTAVNVLFQWITASFTDKGISNSYVKVAACKVWYNY